MVHHVKRSPRRQPALVVADMPFMSYQVSLEEALRNAGRFMKETGAKAVKLEGGREIIETIRAIVNAGIPVVGHLGLTPQYVHQLGGYRVQGKDTAAAEKMIDDALALEEAGVFAIVLECVPSPLGRLITEKLKVAATIGIGAGPHCDGQVLVVNDLLGLYPGHTPRFVKKYANLHEQVNGAIKQYIDEVRERSFPGPEHCFPTSDEVLKKLY